MTKYDLLIYSTLYYLYTLNFSATCKRIEIDLQTFKNKRHNCQFKVVIVYSIISVVDPLHVHTIVYLSGRDALVSHVTNNPSL